MTSWTVVNESALQIHVNNSYYKVLSCIISLPCLTAPFLHIEICLSQGMLVNGRHTSQRWFSTWSFSLSKSWVLRRHFVYVIISYYSKRYVQNFWQRGRRTNINTFLSAIKYMLTRIYSSIWLNEGIVLLCGRPYSFTSGVNKIEILLMLHGWIHFPMELLPYLLISLLDQLLSGNLGTWSNLF